MQRGNYNFINPHLQKNLVTRSKRKLDLPEREVLSGIIRELKSNIKRYAGGGYNFGPTRNYEEKDFERMWDIFSKLPDGIIISHSRAKLYKTYAFTKHGDTFKEEFKHYFKSGLEDLTCKKIEALVEMYKDIGKKVYTELFASMNYTPILTETRGGMSIYNFPREIISHIIDMTAKEDVSIHFKIPSLSRWFNFNFANPVTLHIKYLEMISKMRFNLIFNLNQIFDVSMFPVDYSRTLTTKDNKLTVDNTYGAG